MKNPVLITTKVNGEKVLTYNMGTIVINGLPVVEEKEVPFICSKCSTMKTCKQMQANGGVKIGGTSMACTEFHLKKGVLGDGQPE